MSIRETLNGNSTVKTGVSAVMVIGLIGLVIWQIRSSGTELLNKAFYTDDDGKTWFVDRADLVAPFEHQGKTAVRCYVYKCEKSGKQFVGYMEKFTDDLKVKYEQARAKGQGIDLSDGRVYKKPGGTTWVNGSGEAARTATLVECPENAADPVGIVSAQ